MTRSTCTIALVVLLANPGIVNGQFPWLTQSSQGIASSAGPDPSDIVSGLTDAFFGNSITYSERRCMTSAASQFTDSLNNAATSAMQTYKTFSAPAAVAAAPVAAAPLVAAPTSAAAPAAGIAPAAGAAPLAASPVVPAAAVTEGEQAVVGMQLAASLSNLYNLEEQLGKSCLNSDVVGELQKAGDHLTDLSYVGGQLTANGVDVVSEMSDAFTAFENGNYRAFGKDMGTAWRKVLISKPESVKFAEPSAADIEEVTEGLFSSFFGAGFGLEVVADSVPAGVAAPVVAAPAQPPQLGAAGALPAWAPGQPGIATQPALPGVVTNTGPAPATSLQAVPQQTIPATLPPTTVNVDLHKCITKNLPLWESAWSPVFQLVESSATLKPSDAPEMSDLMMAMMDVQLATTNCGIDPTEEAMLFDALEKGKLKTKLDVPENAKFQGAGFASLLSSALEDLQNRQWHSFGSQIGDAMQDLVVVGFAEKYEIDDAGRLRKKIIGASELGQTNLQKSGLVLSGFFGAISVGFLLFVTLVAFRSRQTIAALWSRSTPATPELDRLNGSDLEAVIE